jgi:hypothetical protein
LRTVERRNRIDFPGADPTLKQGASAKEINVGIYDISIEQVSFVEFFHFILISLITYKNFRRKRLSYRLKNSANKSQMKA